MCTPVRHYNFYICTPIRHYNYIDRFHNIYISFNIRFSQMVFDVVSESYYFIIIRCVAYLLSIYPNRKTQKMAKT